MESLSTPDVFPLCPLPSVGCEEAEGEEVEGFQGAAEHRVRRAGQGKGVETRAGELKESRGRFLPGQRLQAQSTARLCLQVPAPFLLCHVHTQAE